jgi:hypothetical protein
MEMLHIDMGGTFGCDSETPHMAQRDGTEWSCRTCYDEPLQPDESQQDAGIISIGFDVCNQCKPTCKHDHELEQGWRTAPSQQEETKQQKKCTCSTS